MRFYVIFLVAPLIALVFTAGCGRKLPGKYGNFANAQSVELVADVVNILKTNYPPAKTRLNLLHSYGDDPFGAALLESLRREGYAIAEYVQASRLDKYTTSETPKPDGFDFAYVVDNLTDDGGMRLSLYVGTDTVSRLYAVGGTPDEPTYSPMGEWVRKQ
mgnify:CR=1 FL=1